jgi:endonuclease YncB( thermonuclease family)
VDAIQSPAIEGIASDAAGGNEWVVVVADIVNWSEDPSTLNHADLTLSLGGPAAPASQQAVAVSDVNLRAGPGTDTAIVSTILEGTSVTVRGGPENGFIPVELAGQEGWVFADFLSVGGAGAPAQSAFVADLAASQAASDLLDISGGEESTVQPGDVERLAWAFPVTAGTRDFSVVLDGEALPLVVKQRQVLNPGALPPLTEVPSLVEVEAVDVTGGSTLKGEVNGQATEIQLAGIDAPVQSECFAQQSETRLQELVGDGISLEAVGDEYLVWGDGDPRDAPVLINHALVEEGFASADDGNDEASFGLWLAEADRQAQAAELGLWAECTGVHGRDKPKPTPTPPPTQTPAELRAAYPVLPDVRELAIRPGNLLGDKVAFTGEIFTIQVATPGRIFTVGDVTEVEASAVMQLWVYAPDGTREPVFVAFDGDTSGMFEGTVVTVYGTVVGTQNGTNAMGGEISQPLVTADIIDFA